ncbi:MAG: hypothetical protein HN368_03165 [Spirochaetales bacterium]|jgi:hypothetical protein|nr:hypothetical protein [Spirochaetales bacterium]
MEHKKKRSAEDWKLVFSDWRKSGESRRGYCGREGISISAFGYWYKKLESSSNEKHLIKIRDLSARPTAGMSTVIAKAGGVEVFLTGNENEALLIRVFRALQAVS